MLFKARLALVRCFRTVWIPIWSDVGSVLAATAWAATKTAEMMANEKRMVMKMFVKEEDGVVEWMGERIDAEIV